MQLNGVTIGVIGAGVMGQALINGLIGSKKVEPSHVWAAVKTQESFEKLSTKKVCEVVTDFLPNIEKTDIFIIATKPKFVKDAVEKLKISGKLKSDAMIISIAAGTEISAIKQTLDSDHTVIRAMPNTPCKINAGITVLSPCQSATNNQMAMAKSIFSSVGEVVVLDEHHLDAVTAVSGSGPAYIFLMMEALADGAVRVGLPRDVAFQLVSHTVLGSAKMLQQSGKHPAELKDEVTTPAGCTIAALLTMEDGKIRSVLARAVEEATRTLKSWKG